MAKYSINWCSFKADEHSIAGYISHEGWSWEDQKMYEEEVEKADDLFAHDVVVVEGEDIDEAIACHLIRNGVSPEMVEIDSIDWDPYDDEDMFFDDEEEGWCE